MKNPDRIAPIHQSKVSDQIFEILKDKITTHEWAPGSRIPTETEIANMFGVSRLSARTAIQHLAALGLVEIKVGNGTFIMEYPLDSYIDQGAELLLSIQSKDDISEFRSFFERAYMAVACKRRTEKDIQKARNLLGKMQESAIAGSQEGYLECDEIFHRTLCGFTRNQFFILVYRLVERSINAHLLVNTIAFSKLPEFSQTCGDENYYLKGLVRFHEQYISALEQRNPSLVMDPLDHLQEIYQEMRHSNEKQS